MLKIKKDEIYEYIEKNKLEYIDDHSNDDEQFDRNFIRNRLMPLISERWPAAIKKISDLSELSKQDIEFKKNFLEQRIGEFQSESGLDILSLSKVSETERTYVLSLCALLLQSKGRQCVLERSSKTLEASSRVEDRQRFPSRELHLSSVDRRHRVRRSTQRPGIEASALGCLSSRSNSTSSGSSRCGYSTRDANRCFGCLAQHSQRSFLNEDHRSVHQMYSLGARELCMLVAISSVDLRDETVDRMRERTHTTHRRVARGSLHTAERSSIGSRQDVRKTTCASSRTAESCSESDEMEVHRRRTSPLQSSRAVRA